MNKREIRKLYAEAISKSLKDGSLLGDIKNIAGASDLIRMRDVECDMAATIEQMFAAGRHRVLRASQHENLPQQASSESETTP